MSAFAPSISAVLVTLLIPKLRGQPSERGEGVLRATLAVAIRSIASAGEAGLPG